MITLFSPSKVNLFLQVRGKLPSGYHELASLFQAISLGDKITFELSSKDKIKVVSKDKIFLPLDNSNLIFKALNAFRDYSRLSFHLSVKLEKKVPVQAGLGGGSGNAATTLFALNELLGYPLTFDELIEISKTLGSDVTFFFSSGTALCRGRGELIEEMPAIKIEDPLTIIKPPYGLSTPLVFQHYITQDSSLIDAKEVAIDFYKNQYHLFNDLEASAFRIKPELALLKQELLQSGYTRVVMSGSGTSFLCMGKPNKQISFPHKQYPIHFVWRKSDAWYYPQ